VCIFPIILKYVIEKEKKFSISDTVVQYEARTIIIVSLLMNSKLKTARKSFFMDFGSISKKTGMKSMVISNI